MVHDMFISGPRRPFRDRLLTFAGDSKADIHNALDGGVKHLSRADGGACAFAELRENRSEVQVGKRCVSFTAGDLKCAGEYSFMSSFSDVSPC